MELTVAIRGDLKAMMRDERRAIDKAKTITVRRQTRGARLLIVNQIKRSKKRAGRLSGGDPKQWVAATITPKRGFSSDPVGIVSGRARYRRAGGEVDLLTVLDEGATITANNTKFLAIPTDKAPLRSGRGGARRASPNESRIPLTLLPAGPDKAVLVRKGTREVLWVLVRQVTFPKKIDMALADARRSAKIVPDFIKALAKEDTRLERKYG